jgi:hypothetical protein
MARPREPLEPNARLCVGVAQVAKVNAGCIANRSERDRRLQFQAFQFVKSPSPAQAGLFFGALLTPRGDVFAFKGATCPSTGSATANKNEISVVIEPAHSLIHARLRAAIDGLDEGEFTEGCAKTNVVASQVSQLIETLPEREM